MSKEQTYWCVYDPEGKPLFRTIELRSNKSWGNIASDNEGWKSYKKHGYTVQKVTINIVTK